jgi:hypothetical protein
MPRDVPDTCALTAKICFVSSQQSSNTSKLFALVLRPIYDIALPALVQLTLMLVLPLLLAPQSLTRRA